VIVPRTLLFAALLALVPLTLSAQRDDRARVEPGSRVRVHLDDPGAPRVVGRLIRSDSAQLLLVTEGGDGQALPWDEIRGVEVSAGRGSWGNALLGAGIGAVVGGVGYRMYLDSRYENDEWNGVVATVVGAPAGALAGFLMGRVVGPERWKSLPFLPVHVATSRAAAWESRSRRTESGQGAGGDLAALRHALERARDARAPPRRPRLADHREPRMTGPAFAKNRGASFPADRR